MTEDVNILQERYSVVNLLVNRTIYPSPNRDRLTVRTCNNRGVASTVWDVWGSSSETFGTSDLGANFESHPNAPM